jgi:hypothetical protein
MKNFIVYGHCDKGAKFRPSDWTNPALALLGQGLKKSPIGKNWILLIIPIYAKVSI